MQNLLTQCNPRLLKCFGYLYPSITPNINCDDWLTAANTTNKPVFNQCPLYKQHFPNRENSRKLQLNCASVFVAVNNSLIIYSGFGSSTLRCGTPDGTLYLKEHIPFPWDHHRPPAAAANQRADSDPRPSINSPIRSPTPTTIVSRLHNEITNRFCSAKHTDTLKEKPKRLINGQETS